MAFASVRIKKFGSRSQLHTASAHALRLDASSQRRRRDGATAGAALAKTIRTQPRSKTPTGENSFAADRDVVAAFDAHLKAHAAQVTKQGGYGLHIMVAISREWVEATGSLHDPRNPRNKMLIEAALAWVRSWAGPESVYAVRLDLDETGGGNVDVFVAPIRIDGRSGRPTVSHSKPLTEIRVRRGQRMSFAALQDDWADYCKANLDPDIQRGVPKMETRIQHLEVEEFKAAGSEAKRRLRERLAKLDADLERLGGLIASAESLVSADTREKLALLAQEAVSIGRQR